jgi:hypothetical protein
MSGTVNQGQLVLDEPLRLPDQARVQVTVESTEDWRTRYRSGLEQFLALIRERPIRAGVRFTREELPERG